MIRYGIRLAQRNLKLRQSRSERVVRNQRIPVTKMSGSTHHLHCKIGNRAVWRAARDIHGQSLRLIDGVVRTGGADYRFEFFEPDDELTRGEAFAICIHRKLSLPAPGYRCSCVRYRTIARHGLARPITQWHGFRYAVFDAHLLSAEVIDAAAFPGQLANAGFISTSPAE